MFYLILKAILTGAIVVAVSEVAKRSSLLAAVIASLPLTSILAMIWLYIDTQNLDQVRDLSTSIFWMVLPSLFFFILFPLLTKAGFRFYPSLILASLSMSGIYWGYMEMLKRFGIRL